MIKKHMSMKMIVRFVKLIWDKSFNPIKRKKMPLQPDTISSIENICRNRILRNLSSVYSVGRQPTISCVNGFDHRLEYVKVAFTISNFGNIFLHISYDHQVKIIFNDTDVKDFWILGSVCTHIAGCISDLKDELLPILRNASTNH
jgi:hypothetical protein